MIRDAVTLLDIPEGEKAEVVNLAGGYGFMRRLQEMGLIPGQIVKVIRNSAMGPVEISVMGTHLAIGRGIAAKIIVKRLGKHFYER